MSANVDLFDRFREDAQGRLVPIEAIDPLDLAKDELVKDIIAKALVLQESMRLFKRQATEDMQAFLELAAEKYGVTIGGKKGNLCLRSFDGRFKAEINVADYLVFDEKILVAKELIDRCIHRWTADSGVEVKSLVEHAFQVDAAGKFSIGRIYGLTKLAIDDPEWCAAMQAIRDALQVVDSKSYIRLYERRAEDGKYQQIPLDLAGL
jgi:hypothetical protein